MEKKMKKDVYVYNHHSGVQQKLKHRKSTIL